MLKVYFLCKNSEVPVEGLLLLSNAYGFRNTAPPLRQRVRKTGDYLD